MGASVSPAQPECAVCGARASVECERARIRCNVREFSNESFTVWRCGECRSLHCLEQVDLERYYLDYPFKKHRPDLWTRLAYGELLRRLRRHGLRPNGSLLDFGCGPGLFVDFLHNKGYAKAQGFDAYVKEHSDPAPLSRQYDFVFSQDVIEHVEDPHGFLRRLKELARPGGTVYVGTPNASEIDLDDPERFLAEIHMPYHRHVLSEPALVSIGRECGLELIARYPRYYFDTPWPSANTRVIMEYIRRCGNLIDAAFEPPRWGLVLRSPRLWYFGLLGWFHTPPAQIALVFRRR